MHNSTNPNKLAGHKLLLAPYANICAVTQAFAYTINHCFYRKLNQKISVQLRNQLSSWKTIDGITSYGARIDTQSST
jgi:hypothetical protein